MKENAPSPEYQWQGSPPLKLKIFLLQVLVCRLCEAVFKGKIPDSQKTTDDLKKDSSDAEEKELTRCNRYATANASVVLFRYMYGVATYRFAKIMKMFGLPLSEATQWRMIETVWSSLEPVYDALIKAASNAFLVMNDDTRMKILAFKTKESSPSGRRRSSEGETKKNPRKGTRTSCVLAFVKNWKIVLYCTGTQIAGEALSDILINREDGLDPPQHMCDGSTQSVTKGVCKVIPLNCFGHARRKFYYHWNQHPEKFEEVMTLFQKIYKVDEETGTLSPQERLVYLQKHATDLFSKLEAWMKKTLEEKTAEPNSQLGKDINYCLNRWEKLTQCLRVEGAPLTNDETERAIKNIVLHRKNSLFYKTHHGAYVGDVIMTITQTAKEAGLNPFEYLVDLQMHRHEVKKNPEMFLPWNWKKQSAV